jgi:hypothetical protein
MEAHQALDAVRDIVGDDLPDWVLSRFIGAALSTGLSFFSGQVYPVRRPDGRVDAVVSLDGWIRMIQSWPEFEGMAFTYSPERCQSYAGTHRPHEWVECAISKRGVPTPFVAREYFAEVNQSTGVWLTHPVRATRNAAMIQAARYAFGFSDAVVTPDDAPMAEVAQAPMPAPAPAPKITPAPAARATATAAPAPSSHPTRSSAPRAQAPKPRAAAQAREQEQAPPPPAPPAAPAAVESEPVDAQTMAHLRRIAAAVSGADGGDQILQEALESAGIASIDAIDTKAAANLAMDALLMAIPA